MSQPSTGFFDGGTIEFPRIATLTDALQSLGDFDPSPQQMQTSTEPPRPALNQTTQNGSASRYVNLSRRCTLPGVVTMACSRRIDDDRMVVEIVTIEHRRDPHRRRA